jgi:hypothetical protein
MNPWGDLFISRGIFSMGAIPPWRSLSNSPEVAPTGKVSSVVDAKNLSSRRSRAEIAILKKGGNDEEIIEY